MSTEPPIDLMTDRAHSARMYDYMLGGKDNYEADRTAADAAIAGHPSLRIGARSQRAFMGRAARFLAEQGIDQYLDIGTGIPTEPNLHQVVQGELPGAHLVYVDNDPIVLAHAAALLIGSTPGTVTYLQGDARRPAEILASEQVSTMLDLRRPVAVFVVGILHLLDDDDVRSLVSTVLAAVAPGSYLVFSHGTHDADVSGSGARAVAAYRAAGVGVWPRSSTEIEQLILPGTQLCEPGIVFCHRWRPDSIVEVPDADVGVYGVVSRTVGATP